MDRRYAVILPACNEEDCLPLVLDELSACLDPKRFVVAVGVNGSTDQTANIARNRGVVTGETPFRGYGHGCQAAVDALPFHASDVDAYIFFAADGANDPRDIVRLVEAFESNNDFVLGCRTCSLQNCRVMTARHFLANRLLGFWCGILTGRVFADLGPLRLISKALYERMRLREWTFGWTIEAQVLAARLRARIIEVPVTERRRLAGVQKVSGVSWRHTLRIGLAIFVAGWRAARKHRDAGLPVSYAFPKARPKG